MKKNKEKRHKNNKAIKKRKSIKKRRRNKAKDKTKRSKNQRRKDTKKTHTSKKNHVKVSSKSKDKENRSQKGYQNKPKPLSKGAKIFLSCFVALIIIVIAVVSSIGLYVHQEKLYASHLSTHLTTINYKPQVLHNSKMNGTYTMIFYMDNCPHCQKTIPKIYLRNHLAFKSHVQYHDLNPKPSDNNSVLLGSKMHITEVPTGVKATFKNGNIIHEHKFSLNSNQDNHMVKLMKKL